MEAEIEITRKVVSVSVNKKDHPELFRAVMIGDNVTSADFPSASHFLAQAGEDRLRANVTSLDILDEIKQLSQLIKEMPRTAYTNQADEKLIEVRNKLKFSR